MFHSSVGDAASKKGKFRAGGVNWAQLLKNKIPIITWLPKCTKKTLIHDLLAGFTVALTEIPQSIAYAGIAGLPLQYGLYSSFMGSFCYAIFGSCKAVNMGSTSIMSLMIQSHVTAMGVNMSAIMSFLGGIIILLLGLLRLGFVVDFFSYPVIAGFTSAAALTIASSQVKNFLGTSGQANEFLESWQSIFDHIAETNKWDTLLGAVSLTTLFIMKEIRVFGDTKQQATRTKTFWKRAIFLVSIARNAIVVMVASLVAFVLDRNGYRPFQLTGHVDQGYPPFHLPDFTSSSNGKVFSFGDIVTEFGSSLGFIPLVAVIESIAVAKVFSRGAILDANQEMIALGTGNFLGAFFQSMPVTASFTRTAVNNASGAKTNLAGVVTGCIILLTLGFLTSTFSYIPKASLAAVIMCAMFYLFEFDAFSNFWRNKKLDLLPFLATLLSCLFISLEYGILIGIATNLVFILYSSARPKLVIEKEKVSNFGNNVYVITPRTTIHFPAAEFFRSSVLNCGNETDAIVINGSYIGNIDVTVAKSMAALADEVKMRKQILILLNFKQSVKNVCLGVDGQLIDYFRIGQVEDVIAEQPLPLPTSTTAYPIEQI